jgi:hypothetical protein
MSNEAVIKLMDTAFAFPSNMLLSDGSSFNVHGMPLRDYFAAKAIPSIMTAMINNPEKDGLQQGAELAYLLADKMMAERAK